MANSRSDSKPAAAAQARQRRINRMLDAVRVILDAQCRGVIPACFAANFAQSDTVVLTPNPNRASLYVESWPDWELRVAELERGANEGNERCARLLPLYTMASVAVRIQGKSQGRARRLAIPEALRAHAQLGGKGSAVCFVGRGARLELFGERAWEQARTSIFDRARGIED